MDSPLLECPEEILVKIFQSMPGRDVLTAARVCSRFRDVVQENRQYLPREDAFVIFKVTHQANNMKLFAAEIRVYRERFHGNDWLYMDIQGRKCGFVKITSQMRDYFGGIQAKSVETNEYTAETTQDAIRTCFEALAEQFNIRELIIIHYYWSPNSFYSTVIGDVLSRQKGGSLDKLFVADKMDPDTFSIIQSSRPNELFLKMSPSIYGTDQPIRKVMPSIQESKQLKNVVLFSDFNRSPFHYPLDLPGSLLHVAGRPPVNLYFSGVNANTVLEMALQWLSNPRPLELLQFQYIHDICHGELTRLSSLLHPFSKPGFKTLAEKKKFWEMLSLTLPPHYNKFNMLSAAFMSEERVLIIMCTYYNTVAKRNATGYIEMATVPREKFMLNTDWIEVFRKKIDEVDCDIIENLASNRW